VHGSGETTLRIVDAPARPKRNIAALLRWTVIGETKLCRAPSMGLYRPSEALPRCVDGSASLRRSGAAVRRWAVIGETELWRAASIDLYRGGEALERSGVLKHRQHEDDCRASFLV
jgi:hypothetical protein